uniref:Uncharacterized protein n=1 Tax=Naja naja TaxID=35670 RepID=A0A8C6X6I4_NAJNA
MMPMWPGVLIAIVLGLVISQYLKILRMAGRFPPGPTPFPVIGNLCQTGFDFSYETFITLAKRHGNVFTLWLGQEPIIILNGFEAVKEGLTAHPEDMSGRPTGPFFDKIGNRKGIIFASGDVWKQHRRIGAMGLKFLSRRTSGLEHQIQEETLHLIEVFDSTKGEPIEPSFHIILSVSNVICALLFGYKFSIDDETFHQLIESIKFILQVGTSPWGNLYNVFPWIMGHLPGPHQKAFGFAESLRSFALQEIGSHKKHESVNEPQDLIDFYLAQTAKSKDDPTSCLDENNLANSIFDFFIAGTETIATTLHWALVYMVAYPDIQAKVQKELDDVLGSSSRLISCSDRRKLPYVNAVIHEIQRYANIILIGIPRKAVKDTTIFNFPIRKTLPTARSSILTNLPSFRGRKNEDPDCWGQEADCKLLREGCEALLKWHISQNAITI